MGFPPRGPSTKTAPAPVGAGAESPSSRRDVGGYFATGASPHGFVAAGIGTAQAELSFHSQRPSLLQTCSDTVSYTAGMLMSL